jgi:hypothetical protein
MRDGRERGSSDRSGAAAEEWSRLTRIEKFGGRQCARKLQVRGTDWMRGASRILDEDGRTGRGVEPWDGLWLAEVSVNLWFPALCSLRSGSLRRCPIRQSEHRERHRCARAPGISSVRSGAQHEFAGEGVRSHPGNSCTAIGEIAHDARTHPFAVKDPCG